MGRQATGCAQPKGDGWVAWLTLADGSRRPVAMTGLVPHPLGCSCSKAARCEAWRAAAEQAALLSRRARTPGASWVAGGRTVAEYAEKWLQRAHGACAFGERQQGAPRRAYPPRRRSLRDDGPYPRARRGRGRGARQEGPRRQADHEVRQERLRDILQASG